MEPQELRQAPRADAKKATKTATANRATPPRPKRGKSSLRAIAARYRELAMVAGYITWTIDSHGNGIDVTDWYAYTGDTYENTDGMGWLFAVHPADRARAERAWQLARDEQRPYEVEYRVRRADGVYRTMLARGVPVFAPDGELHEWVGFCTDITARKTAEDERDLARAEAANRASELEVIFEAIADGILVFDQTGAIVHFNRAYCHLLGMEHVAGFTALSLAERRDILRFRDEQGRPLLADRLPILRILQGETQIGVNALDLTVSRMDGTDITLNVNGAPIVSAAGDIIGGVLVMRDVTYRHQSELQLRDTLTALLKMAEALVGDETAFAQSGYHSLRDKAAQRLVELTRSVFGCLSVGIATINLSTATFTPVANIAATVADDHFWWQAMQRTRFDVDFTATQRDQLLAGDIIRFSIEKRDGGSASLIQDVILAPILYEERLIGLLGIVPPHHAQMYGEHEMALITAITRLAAITIERKRLLREREEALARELASQEAQQRMDEFLSIISHELRAPLTLIKGNVQLAERRLQRIDMAEMEVSDIVDRVRLACDLLQRADRQIGLENRLVTDLLDAARMHSEHLDLVLQRCELVAIVGEIVEEVRQVYTSRMIRFNVPPACLLSVEADAERIGQVVMNYLTNALKYSPAAQPIDVMIETFDGEARLSVLDRGAGLPPAEHERIWERFQRVPDNSQTGLGLGLYICRMIITHHHGRVGLTSAPGQGSTFWFTLPLASPIADG